LTEFNLTKIDGLRICCEQGLEGFHGAVAGTKKAPFDTKPGTFDSPRTVARGDVIEGTLIVGLYGATVGNLVVAPKGAQKT
jgi:hypothetical protein